MPRINVGDTFPALPVDMLYGSEKTMADLFDAPKTVLWCLRYIGCTVCRYDIHLAAQRYDEVKSKGAKIVFMLQSDKELLREEVKDADLPFDIICDPEMRIYQELDIKPAESMEALVGANMEGLMAKNADAEACGFSHGKYEGDEQQLPAMFIVDANGCVLESIYADTLLGLPTVDELLDLL